MRATWPDRSWDVQWVVFRKWGRVGTTIGSDKKEKFTSLDAAKAAFVKVYEVPASYLASPCAR
jgi:predicted DNA-binding WGR domain protein